MAFWFRKKNGENQETFETSRGDVPVIQRLIENQWIEQFLHVHDISRV